MISQIRSNPNVYNPANHGQVVTPQKNVFNPSVANLPPPSKPLPTKQFNQFKQKPEISETKINLNYIVTKKPKIKVVRDYMRTQMDNIFSEEVLMFEK